MQPKQAKTARTKQNHSPLTVGRPLVNNVSKWDIWGVVNEMLNRHEIRTLLSASWHFLPSSWRTVCWRKTQSFINVDYDDQHTCEWTAVWRATFLICQDFNYNMTSGTKLDDIFEHVGEFGRYQKTVVLLLYLPSIFVAMQDMCYIFTNAVPGHRQVIQIY